MLVTDGVTVSVAVTVGEAEGVSVAVSVVVTEELTVDDRVISSAVGCAVSCRPSFGFEPVLPVPDICPKKRTAEMASNKSSPVMKRRWFFFMCFPVDVNRPIKW